MSKVSSVEYPSFSGSNLSIGGSTASTSLSGGKLNASYNMSDNEKAIYDYALSTLANVLPQVNTFDTDTLKSIKASTNAYKNKGMDTINDIYNPMITDLQNNIASRFGNLDNSMFADNLNDIESNRSDAVSAFAQDVLNKQSSLMDDELSRRYNLINLLSGVSDNVYQNALNAISTALGGSSTANTYNNNLYNSLYKQYLSGSNSTSSALSNLFSLGGSSDSSFFSFL